MEVGKEISKCTYNMWGLQSGMGQSTKGLIEKAYEKPAVIGVGNYPFQGNKRYLVGVRHEKPLLGYNKKMRRGIEYRPMSILVK